MQEITSQNNTTSSPSAKRVAALNSISLFQMFLLKILYFFRGLFPFSILFILLLTLTCYFN
jgi:hypothetical protein